MNKFEIKHRRTSLLGFVYIAKRTVFDDYLTSFGLSESNVQCVRGFFVNAEFEDRARVFLSRAPVRKLITDLANQNKFQSLEFRDRSTQIRTGASYQDVEPLLVELVNCLDYTDALREEEEAMNQRFDLYSPPQWLFGVVSTLVFSSLFFGVSLWLSGALVNPTLSVAILMAFNLPIVVIAAWFLKSKIRDYRLPARAFKIHAASTFILLMICGTSFEIFANSAFDPSTATELEVPITAKLEHFTLEAEAPGQRKLVFEVNENQFARIEVGRSREILDIHRGALLQRWYSRQRLKY